MNDLFRKFARWAAIAAGSGTAFVLAALVLIVWALTGPWYGYSDTWQLVINTGTSVVTFLMVFLIQSTQNRDSKALHLKIDELLRISRARNWLVELEDLPEAELDRLRDEFQLLIDKRRPRRSNTDRVQG